MQCSTVQCSVVIYWMTVQYSTMQYPAAYCCPVQYSPVSVQWVYSECTVRVQWVYSVQCTVRVQCTVYSVQCYPLSVQCTVLLSPAIHSSYPTICHLEIFHCTNSLTLQECLHHSVTPGLTLLHSVTPDLTVLHCGRHFPTLEFTSTTIFYPTLRHYNTFPLGP